MQLPAKSIIIGIAVLTLAACTEARLAVHGAKQILGPDDGASVEPYKVGSPYQIAGAWYYPAENPDYDEIGIASWYGPKFHGSLTANGETYDMDGMTAAHRTLPLPSWVRVTNLENGRSVVVRVNDRGPFKKNRILDLSRAAARELDVIGKGTAKVRVTIVKTGGPNGQIVRPHLLENGDGHANSPLQAVAALNATQADGAAATPDAMPTADVIAVPIAPASASQPLEGNRINAAPASPHYVQVGAFVSQTSAGRLAERMTKMFGGAKINPVIRGEQTLYKVWVGPYRSLDIAVGALASIQDTGYAGAHIVRPDMLTDKPSDDVSVPQQTAQSNLDQAN